MSAKRKIRVRQGNEWLTVYPWTHPVTGAKRWRFAVKEGERWRYVTKGTRVEAETAAAEVLRERGMGELVWSTLDVEARRFLEEVNRRVPEADRAEVLAYLRARDRSGEIGEAVERYVAHKVSEAGEKTPHLRTVELALLEVAERFRGKRVAEVHSPDLEKWWAERGAGLSSKRRKDLRAALVAFWRWAKVQGIAGPEVVTAAERLPGVRVEAGEKRVLQPEELVKVLNGIGQEWRAWAVLGAFGGLRPEEIVPSSTKRKGKRGLRCEEIDWQFRAIRLPAEVSKVNRPRVVPMCEALEAGLRWAGILPGMTGPVVLRNPADAKELARLGEVVFGGQWPQDALRHSFGSYRNALVRSLAQVAEEMGTSEAMLHRHYHNPRVREEGEAWFTNIFSIKPASDHLRIGAS